MVRDFYSCLMGAPARLQSSLKLQQLNLHSLPPDLANGLEATFTDTEVKQVIMEMPSDRAPGTDGFSGLFYKVCWDIIGKDFMAVMHELHRSNFNSVGRLNSSIITLLPKKECSLQVADFKHINLIHGAANFFAKLLVVCLAPCYRLSSHKSRVRSPLGGAYMRTLNLFATLPDYSIARNPRLYL